MRYVFAVVIVATFLTGCKNQEIEQLKKENGELRAKVVGLEDENLRLKQTASYYFQNGVSLASTGDLVAAKEAFETVVEKYPSSDLVGNAKKELSKCVASLAKIERARIAEEKRKREEEKYREKSASVAAGEWRNFRNNEDKYYGSVTTWRIKCAMTRLDWTNGHSALGFLNGETQYPVKLYFDYSLFNKIHDGDQIVVTATFKGVSSSGDVILNLIKMSNLGVQ